MQVTARLPAEMVGQIDGLALLEDRTFSQTIERLLKAALAEREVTHPAGNGGLDAGSSILPSAASRSASAATPTPKRSKRGEAPGADGASAASRPAPTGCTRPHLHNEKGFCKWCP